MQTRFYSDELNDDFIDSKKSFSVPENYNFAPESKIWRICAFIVYRLIMTPIAFLYCKLFLHLSIKDNTKTPIKRQKGCFIYANHTLTVGDAFIPSVLAFPKKVYVLVSPKNLAVCSTRGFLKMSGAIVIPQSLKCFKKFLGAVEKRANDNACITVYPEAHVWPYCTFIRHFSEKSFHFPVSVNAPVYISTSVFLKRKFAKKPKVTVYLDGPFYPNAELGKKQAAAELAEKAYSVMSERAKNNSYSYIQYIKKENEE